MQNFDHAGPVLGYVAQYRDAGSNSWATVMRNGTPLWWPANPGGSPQADALMMLEAQWGPCRLLALTPSQRDMEWRDGELRDND